MRFRAPHMILPVVSGLLLATTPIYGAGEVIATGDELIVNTTTSDNQGFPEVATNGNGTFVVAWESLGQDGDGFGIFGQRLDRDGAPIGTEFAVSSTAAGNQFDPSVGVWPDGGFVVTWASYGQDGSGYGIYAQRFDSAGTMVGAETPVNTYTMADQEYPDVAIGADGGYLIVWESHGQDNSFAGVYGQLYDSAGAAVGDEIQINTTTQEEQDETAVTATSDGYIVAWESGGNDTSGDAVMMQFLDLDGNYVGNEMQVNTSISDDQEDPDLARLSDGTIAVVWESDGQDGDGETVVGQLFASDGTPLGGEIQINATTLGNQEDPRIAAIGDEAFLVIFTGDEAGTTDVFGRLLDASGNLVGEEFRVNTSTTDDQDRAAIAADATGHSITAWRAFGGHDGDAAGVLGQGFELTLFTDGFESGDLSSWTSVVP